MFDKIHIMALVTIELLYKLNNNKSIISKAE